MRIVVVGPGAMGCLFAGLLIESGQKDVWLFDKYESRAKEISKSGLKIEGIGGTRLIQPIKAESNPSEIGNADLVLICVKSYDTESASRSIAPVVSDNTTILTLQNGLNNVETISGILGEDKVLAGVTSHGATMLGIGHIRHAGKGETLIGKPHVFSQPAQAVKQTRRLSAEQVAEVLRSAGFQTTVSYEIFRFIWTKLIINAAINPLTAITRLRNGQLLEYDETRKLLSMSAEEAGRVATALGISPAYDDPTSAVEEVCKATSSNISSMLQDILRKKRTEIDAINGAIVNHAKRLGIKAEINATLTYLVKAIERSTIEQ